jgi:hypothetical protein
MMLWDVWGVDDFRVIAIGDTDPTGWWFSVITDWTPRMSWLLQPTIAITPIIIIVNIILPPWILPDTLPLSLNLYIPHPTIMLRALILLRL